MSFAHGVFYLKMTTNEKLLNEIIAFWQPYYPDRKLTEDDARQMIDTVGEFFSILDDWHKEYLERKQKHVD